ncbi:putative prolyl 4-hydroxylase 9 [Raphanus sativus]|uniref:procollagen-proline 4-dioxygenase n=1 Tax=Raphanus sativus TaxID=3726 RepID=A0A6J0KJD6_RAPSA|nr:probable prolyl 4-hydroxylase 9 [Raphanus sativus]KAJ4880717.1 putative prolyl 4-hydroxylase 9 [Raphanus sativus]
MKNRLKNYKRKKLGLATVIVFCSLCFLIGFYASALLSQNVPGVRPRLRMVEMVENGEGEGSSMPHGVTGDESVGSIPFQVLSWKPRALYFPNFATAEQCQAIIERAKVNLKPSALALRLGETAESTQGTRTSSGTFVSASEESSGALEFVEKKIAKATMIPRTHGEAFNILRYELGQKYDSHYDVFNPTEYGPQKSQRIASFLLYLSDVEEGGETMFPFENGANMGAGYDYKQCIGLKVKPRKGDGLLFYSVFPNGTIDQTSLHGSCPVTKGEKWVATKWIRDQDQED